MKVGELRNKLSTMKKEEIIKIASEFYKLIPKNKKEDYNIDSYLDNSKTKKIKIIKKDEISLALMKEEIPKFIDNAKNQYYLIPNNIVPKKERSKWRFKVKKWYKELINKEREDKDIETQAKLLCDLYSLLCESCMFIYFSGYDSFSSVGVEQIDFYKSVIDLLQEDKGKIDSLKTSIELIINNELNRYTLYSNLMIEFINTLDNVDLKYKAIQITEEVFKNLNYKSIKNRPDLNSYKIQDTKNNLAELGLRLYLKLYEIENGIDFFHKYYNEENKEIKLYVLIRILFYEKETQKIKEELQKAIKNGIELRDSLINLLEYINKNNDLPNFI